MSLREESTRLSLQSSKKMFAIIGDMCVEYLTDEHSSCHGEPSAGGEVRGDHDTQASIGEGEFVGVKDEELIHHDDWRLLLTMSLAYGEVFIFYLCY